MTKERILFVFSLLAALALLFVTSCSGPEYPKEIAMLDSLRIKLDSAEAGLNSIDSNKVIAAVNEVNTDLQEITMHFNTISRDSMLDRETATNLTNYRSVRKAFNIYQREHARLQKDIDYSQSQLSNLIHDLEKGIIDEKDAPAYVQRESEEAVKIIEMTNLLTGSVKGMLERYEEAKPKVKEYMQSLKAEKTKEKK